jgi:hypothetical protein
MGRRTVLPLIAFAAAAIATQSLHADVWISLNPFSPVPGGANILKFTDSGAAGGAPFPYTVFPLFLKSMNFSPNGDLFMLNFNETIGDTLERSGPGGSAVKFDALFGGGDIGISGNYAYAGGTKNGVGRGVMAFNATTLDFVRNALPISTGIINDVEHAPDGSVFVSENGRTRRYIPAANGDLTWDGIVNAPAAGNLEFRPGNMSIYLADQNQISRYDPSGVFQGILLPAGSGGFTSINDYTFGPNNDLYVSGIIPGGNALTKFDATTGAFISQFISLSGFPNGVLGDIEYAVPEPTSLATLSLPALLLLRRRRPHA